MFVLFSNVFIVDVSLESYDATLEG